ncbi:DUF4232 domain-containing protein [Streptomyces sp. NPDC091292]|uniref:DUF4232 domain-containing protein n=1 Tax=Streptomyces sp. NPDC091292 TaxID=3365991 RepID=UPI0037F9CD92
MSVIRTRPVLRSALGALAAVVLLAGTTAACGLGAEIDRERNPERRPTPTPTPPSPSPPPMPAPTAGLELPPTPEAPSPTGCPASGVRLTSEPVQGAMGLRMMTLTLTNCGSKPYTLDGYPSLTVLDESEEPMTGVQAVQGTEAVTAGDSARPARLTLRTGESAISNLAWRMNSEWTPYLRVVPRPGDAPVTVHIPDRLDIGPENRLGMSAWHQYEDRSTS